METNAKLFLFLGNGLCLDFVNTEIVAGGERKSLIQNFADLQSWLLDAGVATQAEIDERTASWDAAQEAEFVQQALSLRDNLRRMAEQITANQTVSDTVINAINQFLRQRQEYQV